MLRQQEVGHHDLPLGRLMARESAVSAVSRLRRLAHHPDCARYNHHLLRFGKHPVCLGCACMSAGGVRRCRGTLCPAGALGPCGVGAVRGVGGSDRTPASHSTQALQDPGPDVVGSGDRALLVHGAVGAALDGGGRAGAPGGGGRLGGGASGDADVARSAPGQSLWHVSVWEQAVLWPLHATYEKLARLAEYPEERELARGVE